MSAVLTCVCCGLGRTDGADGGGDGDNASVEVRGGTRLYKAPEQEVRHGTVTPRCDMWAFGVMVFQVVTGRHLPCWRVMRHDGTSEYVLDVNSVFGLYGEAVASWNDRRSSTSSERAAVGEVRDGRAEPWWVDVGEVLLACLERDPSARMTSRECLAELERLCDAWGVELRELDAGVGAAARREMRLKRARWLLAYGNEGDAEAMREGCLLFEGLCGDGDLVRHDGEVLFNCCEMLARAGDVSESVLGYVRLVSVWGYSAADVMATVALYVVNVAVVRGVLASDVVSSASLDVETAVRWAAAACYNRSEAACIVVLDELLGRGARFASVVARGQTSDSESALHAASTPGHVLAVRALLAAGAPVDSLNSARDTALGIAASFGRLGVVRALLAAGADVNVGNVVDGVTPLMVACVCGFLDVAACLVEADADVSLRDVFAATALHYVSMVGHADIVALLCRAGADVDARDCVGDTPLGLATENGHADAADVLSAHGATVRGERGTPDLDSLVPAGADQVLRTGMAVRRLMMQQHRRRPTGTRT